MNKNTVYSPYKMVHHFRRLEAIRENELPFPISVQWDLTNVCNLMCDFCFYRGDLKSPLSDWNSNDTMSTEVVLKTLKELKSIGVKAIEWTGGGSIECHPEYKLILAKSKQLGFENSLVTSGTLLDAETLELIKDFSWVRFSIDASTKETYKKVKKRDLFNVAIKNLEQMNKIKNRNNVVGFSFVTDRLNYKEIYESAILAKNLGCDNMRISIAMTPQRENLFDGIWEEIVANIEKAKTVATEAFKIFAFSNRIHDLSRTHLSKFCYYHHFMAVIAPTGVYPCCRLKADGNYNFGNLEKQSFKDIWFGEKRQIFIESIKNGCSHDCWMTEKNNFAAYLMSKDVGHANYV